MGRPEVGTRIKVTVEKESLARRPHGEQKAVAAITRLVGLSRKTVYQVLSRCRSGNGGDAAELML